MSFLNDDLSESRKKQMLSWRSRSFLLVVWLVSALPFIQGPVNGQVVRKKLRVLFIGNSLTYTNDLPGIIEALAIADGQVKFEYKMVALPNFSLEDHWNNKDTLKALRKGKWDYVVMQQGPSAGMEGQRVLLNYGKRFSEEIRKIGGRPAMFMVWPSVNRAADFNGVGETYRLGAEAVDGLFLPAGHAWQLALQEDRSLRLFSEDGFHPAQAGSYLAALVIYEQLYDRSPVGLPSRLMLHSGDRFQISSKEAGILQLAAKKANEKFRRVIASPDSKNANMNSK